MTDDEKLMHQSLRAMLNSPDDISDEMFQAIRNLKKRLAQPCQEWVKLTDADIEEVWSDETLGRYALSYAIEAKLREKNT